jgi:hypothetical protein
MIYTHALNRGVISVKACRFFLILPSAKDLVRRETVAKFWMLCGPSIMLGRNIPILEMPCSAIDLRHSANRFKHDRLKRDCPDGMLCGPPIQRWAKLIKGISKIAKCT